MVKILIPQIKDKSDSEFELLKLSENIKEFNIVYNSDSSIKTIKVFFSIIQNLINLLSIKNITNDDIHKFTITHFHNLYHQGNKLK